ncbi:MAG: tRNA (adenine-N1)-methyltransferase [Caldivirga sp.]|uniref:tRNA (adenine-N1)-methyltransferase n=1 Tax=Caldivirga sp. TaxID=2080243 RepID=UPI003D0BE948
MDVVKEGDYVLLWHSNEIKVIAVAKRGLVIGTVRGILRLDDILGKPYGSRIVTNLGHTFYITKPDIIDVLLKMPRVTQPIYPKDTSALIIMLNVRPGSRILEAGLGSGYAASLLAMHLKPLGQLISIERNSRYIAVAKKTLRTMEVNDVVDIINGDIAELALPEEYFDSALLDMGDPWRAIPIVIKALKHGGNLAVYVPTISQVEKVIRSMVDSNFIDIKMIEVNWREWKTTINEVRPKTWNLSHTGFIIVAKKP